VSKSNSLSLHQAQSDSDSAWFVCLSAHRVAGRLYPNPFPHSRFRRHDRSRRRPNPSARHPCVSGISPRCSRGSDEDRAGICADCSGSAALGAPEHSAWLRPPSKGATVANLKSRMSGKRFSCQWPGALKPSVNSRAPPTLCRLAASAA